MISQMLTLPNAGKSCPLYIGQGILTEPELLKRYIAGHQVMIVTQQNIAEHYLQFLQNILEDYQVDIFYLPNGEEYKTIESWQQILNSLIEKRHDRNTTLIALGGGVVGDITGFAAGCYLRGVGYIQIPTSLIAQVDSAIGGKTAVNHTLGKNLIGLFYQPRCVLIDIELLKTLPQREYISGLAEIIKYGLILDAEFFGWLEENLDALLIKDPQALLHAIFISAKSKVEVVTQDEKETGIRALLNFGHTFAHAIETANHYKNVLHGEAVAAGMLMAANLSLERNLLSETELQRIEALLARVNFNKAFHIPAWDEFIELIRRDKKNQHNEFRFILLKAIGQAEVVRIQRSEIRGFEINLR